MFRAILITLCLLLFCVSNSYAKNNERVYPNMVAYCEHIAKTYGKKEGSQCIKSYAVDVKTDLDATETMIVNILETITEVVSLTNDDIIEIEEAIVEIREGFFDLKVELFDYARNAYK